MGYFNGQHFRNYCCSIHSIYGRWWYVKDEAIKYVDGKCNTEYIIETYREHLYECKPIAKPISKTDK